MSYPLLESQIMEMAPAVFQDYPAETVADKYQLIKTSDLIRPLFDNNWYVYDAQQRRTRKEVWEDKTYHFIRLRNDAFKLGDDNIDVIISNSHNATSAFKIQLGIYRLVCSNGLTVGTDLVSPLTVSHRGLSSDFIVEMVKLYVNSMTGKIAQQIDYMKSTEMTIDRAIEYAKEVAYFKHNEKYEINYNELIRPQRREDMGLDLWTIYNVVQENLMQGNYHIKGEKDWRMAKRISSPAADIELNTKLFNKTLEYVA